MYSRCKGGGADCGYVLVDLDSGVVSSGYTFEVTAQENCSNSAIVKQLHRTPRFLVRHDSKTVIGTMLGSDWLKVGLNCWPLIG